MLEYFHVEIVMKVFSCSSFRIKRTIQSLRTFAEYLSFGMRVILFSSGLRGCHSFVYLLERLNVSLLTFVSCLCDYRVFGLNSEMNLLST